jgi:hypothetical protein
MLNLAGLGRVKRTSENHTVLADPFVGAGTTWLEALKFRSPHLELRCSDLAPIARLLAADNLEFFSADIAELEKFVDTLDLVTLEHDMGAVAKLREKPGKLKAYRWAERFVRTIEKELKVQRKEGNFALALTPQRIAELPKGLEERLFLYLLLRTSLLDIAASRRTVGNGELKNKKKKSVRTSVFVGFCEQAEKLIRQIKLLEITRTRESDPDVFFSLPKKSPVPGFNLFTGRYSLAYSMNFSNLADLLKKAQTTGPVAKSDWELIRQYDVMTPLPRGNQRPQKVHDNHTLSPNSCDIIITDPPYGFNTDEDPDSLANLYAESLLKMIGALRDNGQLVLCLLDRSHTGRRSPFFSHKEIIIQQVLAVADKMRREVITPAFAVPHQREIFRPPYYWESERALRRAILHFKFRRKL